MGPVSRGIYTLVDRLLGIMEDEAPHLDPREQDFVLLKIAHDVGFNTKSVFNAAFRAHIGMGPSEYRRRHGRAGDAS